MTSYETYDPEKHNRDTPQETFGPVVKIDRHEDGRATRTTEAELTVRFRVRPRPARPHETAQSTVSEAWQCRT